MIAADQCPDFVSRVLVLYFLIFESTKLATSRVLAPQPAFWLFGASEREREIKRWFGSSALLAGAASVAKVVRGDDGESEAREGPGEAPYAQSY
eukprot:2013232-Rhodomonas_salina.1